MPEMEQVCKACFLSIIKGYPLFIKEFDIIFDDGVPGIVMDFYLINPRTQMRQLLPAGRSVKPRGEAAAHYLAPLFARRH